MATIGRNRKKAIEMLFQQGRNFRSFSLAGNFHAMTVDGEWVKKEFETYDFARLSNPTPGRYQVRIHSNLWYEFESEVLG